MINNFDRAFEELIGNEGGHSNHPSDPGGETMWGVTKKVAMENGYMGSMRELPITKAKEIYKKQYWNDYLNGIPYIVAFNFLDAAVNHGVKQATLFLQRALGVHDDGIMGINTTAAAVSINPYKLCMLFNSERISFYTKLRTWRSFGRGWANRVANNLKVV